MAFYLINITVSLHCVLLNKHIIVSLHYVLLNKHNTQCKETVMFIK
jgi:hypothetical protein